ncbi:hypothetical protein HYDPIDRAFT_109835 [Hydnomerulius pinastri MD-312]|nr:hypothetical protein HYDPIDRAFT_109835 [Hydnomerulius pinastri MD-312]
MHILQTEAVSGAEVVSNALAAWRTNCLAFSSVSLVLWDHVITFGQEVECFWSGEWNISRALYLTIRYLTLALAGDFHAAHSVTPEASELAAYYRWMDRILYAAYIGGFVLVLLCQAAVMLRVWYMFSHNRYIRITAATFYVTGVVSSSVLGASSWHAVEQEFNSETNIAVSTKLTPEWYLFFPCITVHTLLFLCTIWRVLESVHLWGDAPMLKRILKEGTVMYILSSGALLFPIIGLSEVGDPLIYEPALLGEIGAAMMVISVCRAMLSIGSLAAMWHVKPAWLLNNAELSRVHWKRGQKDGELIVEIGEDQELSVIKDPEGRRLIPEITVTAKVTGT